MPIYKKGYNSDCKNYCTYPPCQQDSVGHYPPENAELLFTLAHALTRKEIGTINEVKRRVAVAKIFNGDLHMIWRNRELPIPLKRKL